MFTQANEQTHEANVAAIRWEISTRVEADGINQLFRSDLGATFRTLPEFSDVDFGLIEVIFKP